VWGVSDSAKKRLAQALNLVLADDDSQALRERVARDVPSALSSNGLRLLIHHELDSNAAGVGFATATLMAGELGEGAQRLFGAGLWYPGAALVRQLIECGYLLTLMSESRDEADAWMRSGHDEIVSRFMVRHMRKRAVQNFRATEYEKHCDLGGHPILPDARCSARVLTTSSCRPAAIGSTWHSIWPTLGRLSSRPCPSMTRECSRAIRFTGRTAHRRAATRLHASLPHGAGPIMPA